MTQARKPKGEAGKKAAGPRKKNLISIAGYDPTGGAGAGLDVRVFERFGFRGFGVLTAVTAQNTAGVVRVEALPPALIRKQFDCLAAEFEPAGLKVGMSGSRSNLKAIGAILGKWKSVPRVVDPVMKSTSGMPLAGRRGSSTTGIIEAVAGRAELITPNLSEAAALAGIRIDGPEKMREAAVRLFDRSGIPCLVKGLVRGNRVLDVLFEGQDLHSYDHGRLGISVHGTGCFLSSAILAMLVLGLDLPSACLAGIELVGEAMREAVAVGPGKRTRFVL